MPKTFKVYGYENNIEDAKLIELEQISLCFKSTADMAEFGRFVLKCAQESTNNRNWDHEHFFEKTQNVDNIVIALLDDSNK